MTKRTLPMKTGLVRGIRNNSFLIVDIYAREYDRWASWSRRMTRVRVTEVKTGKVWKTYPSFEQITKYNCTIGNQLYTYVES